MRPSTETKLVIHFLLIASHYFTVKENKFYPVLLKTLSFKRAEHFFSSFE